MILQILFFLALVFIGYVIGRWSDSYLNIWMGDPFWAPHHWIYGIILIIAGLFFLEDYFLGIFLFSLGLGHFISDLNDFMDLKVFGSDGKDKMRFWDVD